MIRTFPSRKQSLAGIDERAVTERERERERDVTKIIGVFVTLLKDVFVGLQKWAWHIDIQLRGPTTQRRYRSAFPFIQGGQKTGPFLKCITLLYNDIGRHLYQNVKLFIRSKNDILNTAVTIFFP